MSQEQLISSTAIIHPSAKIGRQVKIGHYSIIGEHVEIGDHCDIGHHVVLQGPTKLGKNNKIFQFASIGADTQDKKYHGEHTVLEVGDNNLFREFTTINRGSVDGGGITKIGHNNWFMAYVHVAHDCRVGNQTIFSNNASLAGHVVVDDYVRLSGFSGAHQFCQIGAYSILGKGSLISKDVPPYMMVAGAEPAMAGLNTVGLKRAGFTDDDMTALKQAYKIIYRQNNTLKEAIEQLAPIAANNPHVINLINFLNRATRGIIR